jgi:DNA-binding NtrC family response regulator
VLPVASGLSERAPAQRKELPNGERRARVLLLDDEPAITALLARALGAEHDVVELNDPREARALLTNSHFDLVLCDVMMPFVSGPQLLAELTPELARKVVFMSGGSTREDVREFFASVPNVHLDKPFDVAQVRRLVKRLLDERPARDSTPGVKGTRP